MKKLYLALLFNLVFLFTAYSEPLSFREFSSTFKKAKDLFSQSQLNESIQLFDVLVTDSYAQIYPSVYSSRAVVLYYLGRYSEAKTDIDTCISLQPYSLEPILYRSLINSGLGDYEAALDDVNYCLNKNPDWADAYQQRGLIYLNTKNYMEALKDFNEAISKSTSITAANISNRGFALYYLGDLEKAKDDFLYSLTIKENDNVYLCLIDICYKLGQYDDGIKYADTLIKKGSRTEDAIIDRAYIYLVQGYYDYVKSDLDSIENACENLNTFHKLKGIYFILTGDKVFAKEEIDMAYKLNPNDSDISILQKLLTQKKVDVQEILKLHKEDTFIF